MGELGYRSLGLDLVCPESGRSLELGADGRHFHEPGSGAVYPLRGGIPRFVNSDAYADSFSFEWATHQKTQLDRFTASSASREQFVAKTGFEGGDLSGRLILDAGVGAGRYADVMVSMNGWVMGVDLSEAVVSAQANLADSGRFQAVQADLFRLPFPESVFDRVVSIGVLHHTPNARLAFLNLARYLRPGGEIAIWVYPDEGDYRVRNAWIPFTRHIPDRWFYEWCRWFVPWMFRRRGSRLWRYVKAHFPFSDQGLGIENDILDTFDGYSPYYHSIHSPEEVRAWFEEAGLVDIREPGAWRTSMRGRRPLSEDEQ